MTLAQPGVDQDGDTLIITSNGKAAHTVTTTSAGFGDAGGAYDAFTFAAGGRNTITLMAAGGRWNLLPSLVGGTATAVTATIA